MAAGLMLPMLLDASLRLLKQRGGWIALAPWLTVWSCDICAYFIGKALGKRKLAPVISPKKTVAGLIGGVIGSGGVMALYVALTPRVLGAGFSAKIAAALVIFGFVGGALGQLADLSLSAIKRQAGIKDYGRLFPGHGGVWDRFDSILFVAPLFEVVFIRVLGL
jgi:phosphatidate cytidylyltransferase